MSNLSQYEKIRLQNIRERNALLQILGIDDLKNEIGFVPNAKKKSLPKRRLKKTSHGLPSRKSGGLAVKPRIRYSELSSTYVVLDPKLSQSLAG